VKRLVAFGLSLGLVVAVAVPALAAPAEKYEVSDFMVVACGDDPADIAIVLGSGSAVVNDNTWTKVMTATVPEGCVLSQAVVQNADNSFPGTCNLNVADERVRVPTLQWQTVTKPTGEAKQVCQGVIE
jgi:hypothetical protein